MTRSMRLILCAAVSGIAAVGGPLSREASATDTMVAAIKAKRWGIQTYRLTEVKTDGDALRVDAILLSPVGDRLGSFARRRTGLHMAANGAVAMWDTEATQLVWGLDHLNVNTDRGVFQYVFNGRDLGVASPGPVQESLSPEIETFLRNHGTLVELCAAIGGDLDASLRQKREEP